MGEVDMKFGVHICPTEYAIDIRQLAVEAEAAGFESLWVSEHSHIPVSLQSSWPGGERLPAFMTHFFDPFVTLAAAASVTSTIQLGTGIPSPPVTVFSVDHDAGVDRCVFNLPTGPADEVLSALTGLAGLVASA